MGTKLVILMGGFVAWKKLKSVTHVVSNTMDDEEKDRLSKNGNSLFVNFTYLKDCLFYKKRLLEIEYPVKIIESRNNGNCITSWTDSKNSMGTNMIRSFKQSSNQIRSPEFKSFLFENVIFYFEKSLKNYKEAHYKVFENSGSIILSFDKSIIKNKEIYYVIEDGFNEK